MATIHNMPDDVRSRTWEVFDEQVETLERLETEEVLAGYRMLIQLTEDLGLSAEIVASALGMGGAGDVEMAKQALALVLHRRGVLTHEVGQEGCLRCPTVGVCCAYLEVAGRRDDLGRWDRFDCYDLSDWSEEEWQPGDPIERPPLTAEAQAKHEADLEDVRERMRKKRRKEQAAGE